MREDEPHGRAPSTMPPTASPGRSAGLAREEAGLSARVGHQRVDAAHSPLVALGVEEEDRPVGDPGRRPGEAQERLGLARARGAEHEHVAAKALERQGDLAMVGREDRLARDLAAHERRQTDGIPLESAHLRAGGPQGT